MLFDSADVIHSYSRADAIRDGVLIDVSTVAREAGVRYPVALTAAGWAKCVAVPPGVAGPGEGGRWWDVVWMLRVGVQRAAGRVVLYALHVRNSNRSGTPPLVRLKAVCGPGDQAEPVITVMLPDED